MENHFLKGSEVTNLVLQAQNIRKSGKQFSDLVDNRGNQFVDFVQQGGGVLGIGLVGYTYILEQAGIRFYSLGGTSAGAINSLLMAGLEKVGDPVSVKILNILSQKDFLNFLDGPQGIKNLIQKKVEGKSGLFWNILWNVCTIYHLINDKLGLNPGKNLELWLAKTLKTNHISTYTDLINLRQNLPSINHRLKENYSIAPAQLSIITSEITTHTRVELPKMANLYWDNIGEVSPAKFVHTSMAVPYLYYPYEKKNIPNKGQIAGKNWNIHAGYYGKIPPKVKFVDGGLLSNFPINVFHTNEIPAKPTFGARLSTFREDYAKTNTFFSFSGALITTMRQIHDYEVILRNPDYKQLICSIDADREFNWLNFDMTKEDQKRLFILGAKKGLKFLHKFDWEYYKATRKKLLDQ